MRSATVARISRGVTNIRRPVHGGVMPEGDSAVAHPAPLERSTQQPDALVALATRDTGANAVQALRAVAGDAHRLGATVGLFHADFGSRDDSPALVRAAAADLVAVRQAAFPADAAAAAGALPVTLASRPEALRAALEEARRLGARALVVLDASRPSVTPGGVAPLLDAVLSGAADVVVPLYPRQRFAGTLTSGVVYPYTRALYGRRLRQPLLHEFACGTPAIELLLKRSWPLELSRLGADGWLLATILCSSLRLAQAHTRGTAPPGGVSADTPLSQVQARVLGAMFSEGERQAAVWQRVRGSQPVATLGSAPEPEADAGALPAAADAEAAIEAFRLAQRNLAELWGLIMPPQTLLDLRRLTARTNAELRFPDGLWSHVVFDLALAHRARIMNRDHLAAAFTPLYLGWFGSFVAESAAAGAEEVEARIERLCLKFEEQKPYVIARWRSPDRFNP